MLQQSLKVIRHNGRQRQKSLGEEMVAFIGTGMRGEVLKEAGTLAWPRRVQRYPTVTTLCQHPSRKLAWTRSVPRFECYGRAVGCFCSRQLIIQRKTLR